MKEKRTDRNETAFAVGLLAGLFGLWGIAHLINGKVIAGIFWLIVGPTLGGIALTVISAATLGIGLIFALPIWILFVYWQAKSGAAYR